MSKRIEQSRRHGHFDPRYLVAESHELPTAPNTSPREPAIGPERLGLLARTRLGTKEWIEL